MVSFNTINYGINYRNASDETQISDYITKGADQQSWMTCLGTIAAQRILTAEVVWILSRLLRRNIHSRRSFRETNFKFAYE